MVGASSQLPYMEGSLDKKSPSFRNAWQTRFFVLKNGELTYFKGSAAGKQCGCITVRDLRMDIVGDKEFDLVCESGRVYSLRAPYQSEVKRWEEHILDTQSILDCGMTVQEAKEEKRRKAKEEADAKEAAAKLQAEKIEQEKREKLEREQAAEEKRQEELREKQIEEEERQIRKLREQKEEEERLREEEAKARESPIVEHTDVSPAKKDKPEEEEQEEEDQEDQEDDEEDEMDEEEDDVLMDLPTARSSISFSASSRNRPSFCFYELKMASRLVDTPMNSIHESIMEENEEDEADQAQKPDRMPVDAIAHQAAEVIFKEGWLKKQPPKDTIARKKWQNRWFVLNDTTLKYYKKDSDVDCLGAIELAEVSSVSLSDKEECGLVMKVGTRVFSLLADTKAEAQTWVKLLKVSQEKANQHGSVSGTKARLVQEYDETDADLLRATVERHFSHFWSDCPTAVTDVLAASDLVMENLTAMVEDVSFCTPPRDDIIMFYVREFHRCLYPVLEKQFTTDNQIEAADITKLVAWVQNYEDQLVKWVPDVFSTTKQLTALPQWKTLTKSHVPFYEGYLLKRSPKGVRQWQRRWFVLRNCNLYWYRDASDANAAGVLRLDDILRVTIYTKHSATSLKLKGKERHFYMQAETVEEAKKWLNFLSSSLQVLKATPSAEADFSDDDDDGSEDGDTAAASEEYKPVATPRRPRTPSPYKAEALRRFEEDDRDGLEDSIQERLVEVFTCPNTNLMVEGLEDFLAAATAFVQELTDTVQELNDCVPAAPEEAVEFYCETYNNALGNVLNNYLESVEGSLPPQDVIALMRWIQSYNSALDDANILCVQRLFKDSELVQQFVDAYTLHVKTAMEDMCEKVVTDDIHNEPQADDDGRLFTMAPVDIAAFYNQQIDLAKSTESHQFLFDVTCGCLTVFDFWQSRRMALLEEKAATLDFERLCAIINNKNKFLRHVDELKDNLDSEFPGDENEAYREKLGDLLSEKGDGFYKVMKKADAALVNVIIADIHDCIADVFDKRWYEENLVAHALATFEDYFKDLLVFIEEMFFRKTVQGVLDRFVFLYLEALLSKKHKSDTRMGGRIEEDVESIKDFFVKHQRENVVTNAVQPLVLVKDVMTCEPEMLEMYLEELVKKITDASLPVCEKLLSFRTDVDKAVRKAALDAVPEMISKAQDSLDERLQHEFFALMKIEKGVLQGLVGAGASLFKREHREGEEQEGAGSKLKGLLHIGTPKKENDEEHPQEGAGSKLKGLLSFGAKKEEGHEGEQTEGAGAKLKNAFSFGKFGKKLEEQPTE